jgi:hypothetical protein
MGAGLGCLGVRSGAARGSAARGGTATQTPAPPRPPPPPPHPPPPHPAPTVDFVRQHQQAGVGRDDVSECLQPVQGVHGAWWGRGWRGGAKGWGAAGWRGALGAGRAGERAGRQGAHKPLPPQIFPVPTPKPPTRGVAGRAQDDHAAARGERRRERLGAQQEAVLRRGVKDDGDAPCQAHHLGVGNPFGGGGGVVNRGAPGGVFSA